MARRKSASLNGDEQNGTAAAAAEPASESPVSAAERFAALEERLFAGRAARVDGKIERGHGSLFRRLSEDDQRRYLALEAAVAAEAKVALARTALTLAQQALADAEARSEALKE